MPKIEIIGVNEIPLIKEGDDIPNIIVEAIDKNNLSLENGDVLVIAQTIISKSIGKIINLNDIKPSQTAYELSEKMAPLSKKFGIPVKDPELIEAILNESSDLIKTEHVMIVETKHGFVCANAGIDKSNIKGADQVLLLPDNPDLEAEKIMFSLFELTGKQVAVIISDSFGRPFRVGAVGVAVGVSGITPILDKRGSKDLFGKELKSTIVGQIDNLASAAQLVMGEADEGLPVIILRGYKYDYDPQSTIKIILREKSSDLFRQTSDSNLKSRRSYKKSFSTKFLKRQTIEDCISIARWAPSAHNGQFWRYIILEKNEIRHKLIDEMNQKLREDLRNDNHSQQFINQKIKKTRENFLKSQYLILLCLDKKDLHEYTDEERKSIEYIMGVQSISASATYLLLALESKGIAACWYCAPLFAKEIIKKRLNLPKTFSPMTFFTVGYPLENAKAPIRKKLKDIIYKIEIGNNK